MKNYMWYIVGAVVLIILVVVMSGSKTTKKAAVPVGNTNSAAVIPLPTLDISDTAYTPPELTFGISQTIHLVLKNTGVTAHSFTFDKLDYTSGPLDPGQSKTVTFTTPSKAGRYGFHSSVGSDKDKGLVGTLIVQ